MSTNSSKEKKRKSIEVRIIKETNQNRQEVKSLLNLNNLILLLIKKKQTKARKMKKNAMLIHLMKITITMKVMNQ
jgi:hypothetical protein